MKTIKIFFLLIGISVSSLLYAQDGHLKCAPGCVYAQELQGKNTVSCIDRVCSICHEKQEKERKEKLEADKLAAQKRKQEAEQRKQQQTKLIADQKKQVAIQRQKAKENEIVLVAPIPKVNQSYTNILSADEKRIIDIDKNEAQSGIKFDFSSYTSESGITEVLDKAYLFLYYYDKNDKLIYLPKREILITTNYFTQYKKNGLSENDTRVCTNGPLLKNGYFIISYGGPITYCEDLKKSVGNKKVFDLVNLNGEPRFNNEDIFFIQVSNDKESIYVGIEENGTKNFQKYLLDDLSKSMDLTSEEKKELKYKI